MECNNHKECNYRLNKLIGKLKTEISKSDYFLQNYKNYEEELIYHKPNKDEKKKIIKTIKTNSSSCSVLIDQLKVHRKEIKTLLKLSDTLMDKYEKLKIHRKKQIEQVRTVNNEVENLRCRLNNILLPIGGPKKFLSHLKSLPCQNEKNNQLEKAFRNIILQISTLQNNCDAQNKRNEDKALFSFVIKYIKKAFDFLAKMESKEINFIDYVLCETKNEDD
ncbi:PREDICTED: uncharacterized protein LOC105367673 [Ceratosolen solmsi marchali]|uniref:Uncharacterized protein LOC105367673 n=1 Tax=Ceratosolen solmsi marchali TaxID=326594 RepID=A0AAJ7E1V1_9HYME|nr:PREDICTED: uncharacterized protein LOC105367673 [Ceratosolen solmsi marchali]